MPLWKFKNLNKYGNIRTRIMHTEDSSFTIKPKGLGPFIGASRFHYESRTPYHGLMTSPADGKTYLTPDWIEVLPQTTLADIKVAEEETRGRKKGSTKIENPREWKFESKSDPDSWYVVKHVSEFKVTCTCMGQYRAKDRQCRHMKEVMKELGL
tara:strand:+ start:1350 stop:1811 length:462 start_codon:yes stop_codon:yes gene_type:complete